MLHFDVCPVYPVTLRPRFISRCVLFGGTVDAPQSSPSPFAPPSLFAPASAQRRPDPFGAPPPPQPHATEKLDPKETDLPEAKKNSSLFLKPANLSCTPRVLSERAMQPAQPSLSFRVALISGDMTDPWCQSTMSSWDLGFHHFHPVLSLWPSLSPTFYSVAMRC